MKRQSIIFKNLTCYSDGRVFCNKKEKFLSQVNNLNRDFPYFNVSGKRILCKSLIAETFILERELKRNEKVININKDISNNSVINLKVVTKNSRESSTIKEVGNEEFYNWNDTALYC